MGRKNIGDQRRSEIIISFYEVSRSLGLENASIAKLAQHMGISKGLVLHYFKNREELLLGLNEYILEQHLRVMVSEDIGKMDCKEHVIHFIENLFTRAWNTYFDDGVFYSCYALVYRVPEFKESFKAYLIQLHEVLYKKLEEAVAFDVIVATDLKELTEVIFALIDGAYYYLGMYNEHDLIYKKQVAIYVKYSLRLLDFRS
ncbi:TetR family transcriptional regulator [Leeuwenhoekiella marinoflava]|uniref:Biofilm operon icaADBC HTH-type negative transcriptional regulator IcaR n=2 Tax=Leeuwenhoekiella marinoflava TaxID=988 RepID=A0A4Q0PLF0_9FLAO|nr:TetR family transcriptional regulator [Leeuwenhoekiella marinoflava]RXG29859.1 TetR family transcriptional regulator [Leeuwenhoekiella marinoflava]SHF28078.1 transcriptional regulator, TetR family [Leeuwenhoekiella marinoflava DSM 3653]